MKIGDETGALVEKGKKCQRNSSTSLNFPSSLALYQQVLLNTHLKE